MVVLSALLAATAVIAGIPATALAATGTISGTVSDATNPQANVTGITVEAVNQSTDVSVASTTTGASGVYSISGLDESTTYIVEFAPGSTTYVSQWWNDASTAADATAVTFTNDAASGINASLTEQTGQISGTVTDATTTQGISDIEVELENVNGDYVQSVETGGGGTYTLSGITPGTYVVQFNPYQYDSDYGSLYYNGSSTLSGAQQITVGPGSSTPSINAALPETTGTISGTVTDASSQAGIQNIEVQLYDSSGDMEGSTTTAANGSYSVAHLQPGAYKVEFQASGLNYVSQYYNGKTTLNSATPVTVSAGVATSSINAALVAGGKITGTVTSSSGAGLQNAAVIVYDVSGMNEVSSSAAGPGGVYTAQGLASGLYVVEFNDNDATPPAYLPLYYNNQPVSGGNPTLVAVTEGQSTAGINGSLAVAGAISGTVTDQKTGQPIEDVMVELYDASGQPIGGSMTASNGTYEVDGLTTGSYRVQFSPEDSTQLTEYYGAAASLQASTPVSVTSGTVTQSINQALLEASQGGTISGTVTSAGEPIAGVTVTLFDASGTSTEQTTTTGSDGTYQTVALLPGSYKVEFSTGVNLAFQYYNGQATLAGATPVTVSTGANTGSINATLSTGGVLSGTVTDASTKVGLPDVAINLLDASGDLLASGDTNPDGTYSIVGIPAGTYHVEFVASGSSVLPGGLPYATQYYSDQATLGSSGTVTITAGATTSGVNAALVSKASQKTQVITTTVTQTLAAPQPGLPTASGGALSGAGAGKPVLKLTAAAGINSAPLLKTIQIDPASGLSFNSKKLKKGVKVSGGGGATISLSRGDLVITLKTDAAKASVTIASPAITITKSLAKEVKKGKLKSLTFHLVITDVAGKTSHVSLVITAPH